MYRYEKELTHPITNLLNGELARAMLIQVVSLLPISKVTTVYIISHVTNAWCHTGSEAKAGY